MTRIKKPFLANSRVWLRVPKKKDRKEFLALIRRSNRFYRGLATPPKTEEEFDLYLARCRKDDFVGFLVCRTEDGAIIGVINLFNIVRSSFQNACMGYYVGAPFAGQGYMTKAIQLVLHAAFGDLKLHRIEANIQPQNKASLALAKRAGFVKEGYSARYLKIGGKWRDHERWAILAEDWHAKNIK